MNEDNIQIRFLNQIKALLHPSKALVDELSDILNISPDSAYRRIRGETALSIQEVSVLCTHYKISFDLFTGYTENTTFHYDEMPGTEGFFKYLNIIKEDLEQMVNADNKQLIFAAIDIPIFHHFRFTELSAFKMFYWMKSIKNVEEFKDKKFTISEIHEKFTILGKEIYDLYTNIPSIEIWTDETINSLTKQIEFFWDSGNFENKEDALIICEQTKAEIETIQKKAEMSNKIIDGTGRENSKFSFYHSDIELGKNCIFIQKGDVEYVYLTIHTFNIMTTANRKFVDDTKTWLDNLMKKSVLISEISEIQRYQFFKKATEKIDKLSLKIEKE